MLLLVSLLGGCVCPKPVEYTGPTESMAAVAAEIDANNSRVPTLFARHAYEAHIVDEHRQTHFVSGEGVLLYASPMSLRLTGDAVVGTLFDIGSNNQSFWLKLGPSAGDTMWWGNYKDLDQGDVNLGIPIRPDMVLEVLGIGLIDSNFNAMPAPVMRFNSVDDAYVFLWIGKLPDRFIAMREVWYDRATKQPKRVLLYDANGRVVLRGDLSGFRQVMLTNQPKETWPWIPGDYKLSFPDTGSRLQFTLTEAELRHHTEAGALPIARSFRMPSPANSGVNRVIQIGKHADQ